MLQPLASASVTHRRGRGIGGLLGGRCPYPGKAGWYCRGNQIKTNYSDMKLALHPADQPTFGMQDKRRNGYCNFRGGPRLINHTTWFHSGPTYCSLRCVQESASWRPRGRRFPFFSSTWSVRSPCWPSWSLAALHPGLQVWRRGDHCHLTHTAYPTVSSGGRCTLPTFIFLFL